MNTDPLSPINACFFYLFAGMIAGTVAQFIVRGRIGCLLGNFFLGIVGAVLGHFVYDTLQAHLPAAVQWIPGKSDFLGVTVLASVVATLIALVFNQALQAERRHQQRLLGNIRQNDE